jgi:hypothetical protein
VAIGTLIAESMRAGTVLEDRGLAVREIRRVDADVSAAQRAAGLAERWTLIGFQVADDRAGEVANAFAAILDAPGWYADLRRSRTAPGRRARRPTRPGARRAAAARRSG